MKNKLKRRKQIKSEGYELFNENHKNKNKEKRNKET